jgi:hypothetical protein
MGPPAPFLRLDDLILPPPLPAMAALLVVSGLVFLGRRAARLLRGADAGPLDEGAGFVLAAGCVAALVHGLAWAALASLPVLRLLAALLAAAGLLQAIDWARRLGPRLRTLPRFVRERGPWERAGVVLLCITAVAALFAALGPPTDADSLDYHLGVPLEWLREGRAIPRPDWLHARLVGLGEALNMLGLAAGTDCLGAVLQASGLGIASIAVTAFARTAPDRLLGALFVLGSPVLCVLVLNQKPQLLPAAGIALALSIAVQRFRSLDAGSALLCFGCIGFALGCKYSFLLSAGVVAATGLLAARASGRLAPAAALGAVILSVLVVPALARTYAFYGDPLSPFLERWKADGDPAVVEFAAYLRSYGGDLGAARFLRLPLDLLVAFEPSAIQGVLGLGALGFVVALRQPAPARALLLAAAAAAVLVLLLGQITPRFFIEPYLFCAAAAVAAPWGRLKTLLSRALVLQAALVAALAVLGAVTLFPGALTPGGRDRVMTDCAHGYAESRWMDEILPAGATVLAGTRSRALLPRRFAVDDVTRGGWGRAQAKERLVQILRQHGVTALVASDPPSDLYGELIRCSGTPIAEPRTFRSAVRNPLLRGATYRLTATALDLRSPRCSGTPAGR